MTKIDGYHTEQFEKSDVPTYERVEYTTGRVTAYVAFLAHTTTLEEESDILWWAKTYSEPEWWTDNGECYKVYRIYIKELYLHNVTEELRQINGVYLRRECPDATDGGETANRKTEHTVLGHDINEIWDESDSLESGCVE